MPGAVLEDLASYGPDRCPPLSEAQARGYVRRLTARHDENFTVLSRLLPRRLRPHFAHVYAFCRWADDLGDEIGDPARSLELLGWWRRELDWCYRGQPRHPVFIALRGTVERWAIPRSPFDDLLDAFEQDQRVHRYQTWEQVLDYCTRSANPVGRLVLYLGGVHDERGRHFSDATCTGLQLANFWQDVKRDVLERGRVYIPRRTADLHGLDLEAMVRDVQLAQSRGAELEATAAYRKTLRALVRDTWPLFEEGRGLWPLLDPDVRPSVKLFTLGGESILQGIERQDYDTLRHRPRLGRAARMRLMTRVALERMMPAPRASRRRRGDG